MAKRETVGKIATDLLKKQSDPVPVVEQTEENLTEYEKELMIAIARGLKLYPSDFYVVVTTKLEPLMHNVLRNFFVPRKTCPTPDYDQIVYRYTAATQSIDFLWVIPSREASMHLKEHAVEVVPAERPLLQFVLDFADGSLMKLAMKLNHEKADALQGALIKTDEAR